MQALGGEHMGFDQLAQRIERGRDRTDRISHGRERDRRALQGIALALPVQRLMLAELLEHDHRKQARPGPSPRDDMIRSRRLTDRLAVAAGKLLPHGLDHLPPARLRIQRPRHILAELAQAETAAAFAPLRRIDHHPFSGKMLRESIALRGPPGEAANVRRPGDGSLRRQLVFRRAGPELFKFERQLLDQPRRAFRSLSVDLALELGDPQPLLRDQRHVFRSLRASDRQLSLDCEFLRAFGRERRLQRGDVVGQSLASRFHEAKGIIFSAIRGALKCR